MDLRITKARISFANGLFNASAAVEGGLAKYGCDFIVTPESTVERKGTDGKWIKTTLKDAQALTAAEAFKGDAKKAAAWFEDLDARQRSVRDGNKNKDKAGDIRDGYEGNLYIAAKSKTRMPVYTRDLREVHDEADSPIYSGSHVVARVSLYCNLKPGQKGMFASLQGTQFHSDGDAFGGGTKAGAGDFEPVTEGADSSDFA
jgi:hypothetical protein